MFITNSKRHRVTLETIFGLEEGLNFIHNYIRDAKELAIDFETPCFDSKNKQTLLCSICDGVSPFIVIDTTSIPLNQALPTELIKDKLLIAHNAKFEYGWLIENHIKVGDMYCTMIAEKKLTQGSGLRVNFVDTCKRHGIILPEETDKTIRDEFATDNPLEFIFEDRHILYSGYDVVPLHEVKEKQQVLIDEKRMNFLIHRIHMPLLKVLTHCEKTGFIHNSGKLREYLKKVEIKIQDKESQMNDLISSIDIQGINKPVEKEIKNRDKSLIRLSKRVSTKLDIIKKLEEGDKTHLKSYETHISVLQRAKDQLEEKNKPISRFINWGSSDQVLEVFRRLGVKELPKGKNKDNQVIDSLGKDSRPQWLANNKDSVGYPLMKIYDEYKKITHNFNNFGEKWINKYVDKDNKVYTIYRQAGTTTGRFACGDKRKGYPNLQQIPTVKDENGEPIYRTCFTTDPGRMIFTGDYSGCEIVVMISLSGDLELKKISELPDQHSYVGTIAYRNYYKYKYETTKQEKYKKLAETFTMSKEETPDLRSKYKNTAGVFPVVYGAYKSTVSNMLGIPKDGAQILIDTIKELMPNVINFVESKVAEAYKKGYVTFNKRTNSIRMFQEIIDHNIYGDELSFMQKVEIEGAARNSAIQGTNGDIVCEAIVLIDKWIKINNLDIRLLGQVHDEIIYDMPDEYVDWIPEKLKQLMCRAANNYLIPEIRMQADYELLRTWTK